MTIGGEGYGYGYDIVLCWIGLVSLPDRIRLTKS